MLIVIFMSINTKKQNKTGQLNVRKNVAKLAFWSLASFEKLILQLPVVTLNQNVHLNKHFNAQLCVYIYISKHKKAQAILCAYM